MYSLSACSAWHSLNHLSCSHIFLWSLYFEIWFCCLSSYWSPWASFKCLTNRLVGEGIVVSDAIFWHLADGNDWWAFDEDEPGDINWVDTNSNALQQCSKSKEWAEKQEIDAWWDKSESDVLFVSNACLAGHLVTYLPSAVLEGLSIDGWSIRSRVMFKLS